MFCSFGPEAKIVRLFGKGTVYEVLLRFSLLIQFGSKEFDELVPVEKRLTATRAVIRVDITKAAKSCGYGVPIMQLINERDALNKWGEGLTRKVQFHFCDC